MRKTTLCFLIDGDHICLAMKKRGFGVGKLNGAGGKVEGGESVIEAAARETKEELGVNIATQHLEEVGQIKFYYNDKPDWDQHVHIYLAKKWGGDPTESEEMKPSWHHKDSIPYENMWLDDKIWLPKIVNGENIVGEFYLTKDGSEILKFSLS